MTTAPLVPHSVSDSGINGGGHLPSGLPRYHPIAMNPNPPPHPAMPPPDQMVHNHHFRHFAPPLMHDPHSGPPPVPPTPSPTSLEQIEQRLRQLEHEEMNRMATRSHILAVRKREDEEFRRLTESAEIEEEDLRRQRKRMKRESMGLGSNHAADSPPLRPTPPRRLSETSAATTLAFFKQQSPPEPRQAPLPPVPQPQQAPPMPPPTHLHQPHQSHQPPHSSHQQHQPHASHPPHQTHQPHQPHHAPPPPQSQHHLVHHDSLNGPGSIRRKQKYTIKNVEAWGERHGRPAAHDPSGRALWKRPSDGSLVYLTCPIQGCGKSDFVTLHGFMCHLTKKHKDRTLGSQSRALELCGIVFDPNSPLPPVTNHRGSAESATPMDMDGDGDEDLDSDPEESEDSPESYRVKTEGSDRLGLSDAHDIIPGPHDMSPVPIPKLSLHGSVKQSISSIIDRTPEPEHREALASLGPSEPVSQVPTPILEQTVPVKRKFEYSPEKENTEPKEGSATE
ncbi:hypothetical protein N7466_001760 [Penicillium verhagenii]|uniref:uncharacterized protein n=1 Tax=Penicillium verhagenii TaxID=1562060 RepID=UPI00254583DE|nr:uncharacterized protein N7466_001760 [Penicillium verhagenii]KAJ5938626.1 hypothetical protein N7466_001760 [Penicillium verhagenii]